jgi:hypothetical protein
MLAVISAIYDLMGDGGNVADQCPELHVNKIFKVHKLPIHLYINLGMTRQPGPLLQFVSPDDEHNVLETCRELK